MKDFSNTFGKVFEAVLNTTNEHNLSTRSDSNPALTEDIDLQQQGPQSEYLLQSQIRPVFGKASFNKTKIGTHPDFLDMELDGNPTRNQYICSMFVDIVGSTKLSLNYELTLIHQFKNAVLKTCIEVVRSFDGYVHRLMGDATMAFFGDVGTSKEDAIANTLNSAMILRLLLENSIKPWMIRNGLDDKDFGFRIGCDFGDDHNVLWGRYGFQNVGEVSATGFQVDMASKLQGLANKNQTMLGNTLLNFVDWPEFYTEIKTRKKGGIKENVEYVTPNLTDKSGNKINYKMRLLDYYKFLRISAVDTSVKQQFSETNVIDNISIFFKCYTVIDDVESEYISSSRFLEKDISLKFVVLATSNARLNYPLTVSFSKTNYGAETPDNERGITHEPVTKYIRKPHGSRMKTMPPFLKASNDERTLYRGMHTMKCEIKNCNGGVIYRNWIGVMIK